ncbi:LacI family DNA-binding transcriptional regulator [Nocardiopsis oceani]
MNNKRSATVASVAEAAGVSRQTVSNVINAPERVRPRTRERVEAAIRDLDYEPNRVARSLRTSASRMLGYCVWPQPDAHGVMDRFLHAVTEAAGEHGYHVLLFTAPSGAEGLPAYERLIAQHAVDGFVLADTVKGDVRQQWLSEQDVPFAAFGRSWSDPEHGDWVDVDGAAGTREAVEHLHTLGHRRIGFVGWEAGSGVGDDRRAGWAAALDTADLPEGPSAQAENSVHDGTRAALDLLDRPEAPTALVCASDMLALGALGALAQRGLTPGRDVAVVGFDDLPAAALPGVELTTLRQPIHEIGRGVVDLVLARLDHRSDTSPRQTLLRPKLVVRTSSRPEPLPPKP